jgi:hypothetical protein
VRVFTGEEDTSVARHHPGLTMVPDVPARRIVSVVAALTMLTVTGGCGDDASPDSATTRYDAHLGSEYDGGVAVPAAFDVQAELVGGGTFDLAAHAGRPVVLWFWAPS